MLRKISVLYREKMRNPVIQGEIGKVEKDLKFYEGEVSKLESHPLRPRTFFDREDLVGGYILTVSSGRARISELREKKGRLTALLNN